MWRTRVRPLIEAVGAVAVVVSVLFLAVQIKSSNDIAEAAIRYDLLMANNEWQDLVASDDDLGELLDRLRDAEIELSGGDRERARAIAYRLANQWAAVHAAYAMGQIPRWVFDGYSVDVSSRIDLYPGLVPFFRGYLIEYPHMQDLEIFAAVVDATGLR